MTLAGAGIAAVVSRGGRPDLAEKMTASEFAGIDMYHLMLAGSTSSLLLQMIQQEKIDLVVRCRPGSTGFKRRALGRVAQKVVRKSLVSPRA